LKYPSKVDWWLAALVFGAVMGAPLAVWLKQPGHQALSITLASSGLAVGVLLLLAWPVHYTITDSELLVRSGIFLRWSVKFNSITAVSPTRNPLSSPAWSLDRLDIEQSFGNSLLISPVDQERFLQDLALRAGLTRVGDRLIRQ
jgi:hypothetical protein